LYKDILGEGLWDLRSDACNATKSEGSFQGRVCLSFQVVDDGEVYTAGSISILGYLFIEITIIGLDNSSNNRTSNVLIRLLALFLLPLLLLLLSLLLPLLLRYNVILVATLRVPTAGSLLGHIVIIIGEVDSTKPMSNGGLGFFRKSGGVGGSDATSSQRWGSSCVRTIGGIF